ALSEEAIGAELGVELVHPSRKLFEVIIAGYERARRSIKEVGAVGILAAGQHCRAVLYGHCDNLGPEAIRESHLVADRGSDQAPRACRLSGPSARFYTVACHQ